jgi:hypothetical protein
LAGLHVGSRVGASKRTQDQKEWFVARHVLKTGLRRRIFTTPLSIEKQAPPAPDFAMTVGDKAAFIEITEATHPDDQREMTRFEQSGKKAMLIGDFGGRFAGGLSRPGVHIKSRIDAAAINVRRNVTNQALREDGDDLEDAA